MLDYDENGNQTLRGAPSAEQTLVYDTKNRLVQVENAEGDVLAEYYHGPFGRRLWKEVGGQRTYFFYAEEGLAAEIDASGEIQKTYGYWPGSTWSTDPLFQKIGSEYYWYQNDHLGTSQVIVDARIWVDQMAGCGVRLLGDAGCCWPGCQKSTFPPGSISIRKQGSTTTISGMMIRGSGGMWKVIQLAWTAAKIRIFMRKMTLFTFPIQLVKVPCSSQPGYGAIERISLREALVLFGLAI